MQRANFERRQGDLQTADKLMRAAHAKADPDDIVDITKQVWNARPEARTELSGTKASQTFSR